MTNYRHFSLPNITKLVLLVVLLTHSQGCLHLSEPLEKANWLERSLAVPAPSALHASDSRRVGLAAAVLALAVLAYACWRWRRAWREAGQDPNLDREDLALLRTARDAVGFLAHKQMRRFKVVSLALHRQRRVP